MSAFEKALISSVCACVAGLALVAAIDPLHTATKSPRAEFVVPDMAENLSAMSLNAMSLDAMPLDAMSLNAMSTAAGFSGSRVRLATVANVANTFRNLDYNIERVRVGAGDVPRFFLPSFPRDMRGVSQPEARKKLFFKMVLPLVLSVNDKISEDRQRLLKLIKVDKAGKRLAADDRLWLAAMTEYYDVERGELKELARRMDTVPPSLAIAQAAEESGWGTSRFAREGNALFGQWTFASAKGIVPNRRDQGKEHRIKAFPSLMGAVRAYVRNLNTHRAYRRFRAERRAIHAENGQLSGVRLAKMLDGYSERGSAYVSTIMTIISTNRLHELDGARLGNSALQFSKKPAI
ncbi:MAG: glucosaminidase domain-containing protein [Rhodospirillales bacterium]|nr:glucosaminidase domain-containing protein [Rhodospirillales bacterium]